MKILFIPFSVVGGLLAGMVGRRVFSAVWGVIDEEEPRDSAHRDVPWRKLVLAAALQGAIFRVAKEAADRGMRTAFLNATGSWPGEERPEPE